MEKTVWRAMVKARTEEEEGKNRIQYAFFMVGGASLHAHISNAHAPYEQLKLKEGK